MKLNRLSLLTTFAFGLLSTSALARPLSSEESALYLDATDLPWMQRQSVPDADDAGPLLGKAMWTSPDETQAIGILQELRWVFSDAAAADAWLLANVNDLSEGMEAANAPTIGDRSYAFGPSFPGAAGLFGDQKPPRMINYVFRVGRVVVKVFVSALKGDDSRLTPLMVSPIAGKVRDRVAEAQKKLGAAPVAVAVPPSSEPPPVVQPVPSAPPPSPPPAQPSEPPSPPENRDYPEDILVFDGSRFFVYGRYLETTNLRNQPDRAGGVGGLEYSFSLFSGGKEDTTGFALHDAVDLELELGMRTSADYEDSTGEKEDIWAFGYAAHYEFALGYRSAPFGLLAGARPGLRGLRIGDVTASDLQLPLMALVELRPDDDLLIALRGHYGFFFDQNAAGLSGTVVFDDEFALRFAYEQYRMSTAIPSDLGGDARVEVGRQVTTQYTFGIGAAF